MTRAIQPIIRRLLEYAICVFCLLRPLWGWMDCKARPEVPPASAPAAEGKSKGNGNVLGEMLFNQLQNPTPQFRQSTGVDQGKGNPDDFY